MNIPQAVRSGWSQYARFAGRASRSEFWYFALFAWLLAQGCNLLDYALWHVGYGKGPLCILQSLILLLPLWGLQVRRLHDIDKSGWTLLKWYAPFLILAGLLLADMLSVLVITLLMKFIPEASTLLPALLFLISPYQQPYFVPVALILVGLSALAPSIAMLILSCRKGTVSDNRFGSDPLALPALSDSAPATIAPMELP